MDLSNRIDLHVHSFPSIYPRYGDDWDIASDASRVGMKAIVLKSHHESTVSRAYLLKKKFPNLEIFGGIVLNKYVGGINPEAVEVCLRLGGKVVWMPTLDLGGHHGSNSLDDHHSTPKSSASIFHNGRPCPELLKILEFIAQYDVVLATGHLPAKDIAALLTTAKERGVRKMVITHPFYKIPNLDLNHLREFIAVGAKVEFAWYSLGASPLTANPSKIAEAIKELGPERCLLVSDAGQKDSPSPTKAFSLFLDLLAEEGIDDRELNIMTKENPSQLLTIK